MLSGHFFFQMNNKILLESVKRVATEVDHLKYTGIMQTG